MKALAAALALALGGCAQPLEAPPGGVPLREDLFVQALTDGVWRHVTRGILPTGSFTSNGLIVRAEGGALVVDTGWDVPQTEALLGWTEREVGPVRAVVITHAHRDRLGGIEAVHARGIASVAIAETAALAVADGWPEPTRIVASGASLEPFGVAGELFHPGAGHSPDNVVVHLRGPELLAGTCMIRSGSSTGLGSLAAADLAAWPESVRALQTRYPALRRVVPGHGDPGDAGLLQHTLDLLAAHAAE